MSDLSPRPNRAPSRRSREQRAYQLVVAGSIAAVVAVVGFVLAVLGVIGMGPALLAAVVAVICGVLFRRSVGS